MRIGIVVPAFNAAPWIGDAIASVIAQTHRDWTLVVVDDGSVDTTVNVVARFDDPRIRVIRQANAGVSAARNRGIAALSGRNDALLLLDADDWLAHDALSRLANSLAASPGAVAAVGAYTFVDTGRWRRPPAGDVLERLLVRNLFANGGHLLLRTTAVLAAGGFLTGLTYGEDWEYWIRIARQGAFVATPMARPVLFVRQHPGGAYHRLASDPSAFVPCMAAIFANPVLLSRFGADRLAAIRCRTEAENAWIIGRELIRHGEAGDGRAWLRRSVRACPTAKRAALFAVACMLPVLPSVLRGPFRSYRPLAGLSQGKRGGVVHREIAASSRGSQ
jgi:glycosyltransferase involved in cell wall biosynthesis